MPSANWSWRSFRPFPARRDGHADTAPPGHADAAARAEVSAGNSADGVSNLHRP